MRAGSIELDERNAEVRCSGIRVDVRLSERKLLALLMRRNGTVVPKEAIETSLSNFGHEISANAIEVLVSRLRRALEGIEAGIVIETVRGVGYRLREIDNPNGAGRKAKGRRG
jgi:DNA-binding response OmpR family regulator